MARRARAALVLATSVMTTSAARARPRIGGEVVEQREAGGHRAGQDDELGAIDGAAGIGGRGVEDAVADGGRGTGPGRAPAGQRRAAIGPTGRAPPAPPRAGPGPPNRRSARTRGMRHARRRVSQSADGRRSERGVPSDACGEVDGAGTCPGPLADRRICRSWSSSPTRVLLVDDHQLLTDSLARLLTAEPDIEVVGIAASVAETRRQTSPRVDVALMDYRLPDGTGADATRIVKARWPSARVVMLTAVQDDETVLESIQAGADGYLTKDRAVDDVVAAVRDAHNGETLLPRSVVMGIAQRVASRPRPFARPAADRAPDRARARGPARPRGRA